MILNHTGRDHTGDFKEGFGDSAFTYIDDQGVSGLFPKADVVALVQLLEDVKARTAA
ncbi:hypothetical protein [Asticcacaulis sp. AND118]|uniref:hypothetical protein n=1 Tax=Asticcacaulis sp. AND118 TaxID=2840468 RepID=UPI001CFFB8FC|nr:hypothetical protein [Asticcacaulis sp. AND118]UDF05721.1 hypothetical protein LH365_17940 [Asticcacaulis sp. AND118]